MCFKFLRWKGRIFFFFWSINSQRLKGMTNIPSTQNIHKVNQRRKQRQHKQKQHSSPIYQEVLVNQPSSLLSLPWCRLLNLSRLWSRMLPFSWCSDICLHGSKPYAEKWFHSSSAKCTKQPQRMLTSKLSCTIHFSRVLPTTSHNVVWMILVLLVVVPNL